MFLFSFYLVLSGEHTCFIKLFFNGFVLGTDLYINRKAIKDEICLNYTNTICSGKRLILKEKHF